MHCCNAGRPERGPRSWTHPQSRSQGRTRGRGHRPPTSKEERPMNPTPRLAMLLAATIPAAAASADVLYYSSNFENGVIDPGWGHTARIDNGPPVFTKHMGRYSENTPTILNNSVSLTLNRA